MPTSSRSVFIAAIITLLPAAAAQDPAPPPGGFAVTHQADLPITFSDGYRTLLDVRSPTIAAPASGWPVFVAVHGSGGNRNTPYVRDACIRMARQGYVALAYDTGNQGITTQLNPPGTRDDELRMRDLAEIVHLTEVSHPALLDGTRIAVFGHSAGGKHALWAAAYSGQQLPQVGFVTTMPTVLAIHADAQVLDHPADFLPNGNMIRASWATALFRSQGPTAPLPAMMLQHDYAGLAAYLQGHPTEDLLGRLQQSTVPLLLTYGFDDSKHFVGAIADAWSTLPAGVAHRYVQTTGGHGSAANEIADLQRADLTQRWCDRFLKGIANQVDLEPPVEIGMLPGTAAGYLDPTSAWQHRQAASWPLPPSRTLYLRTGGALAAAPPAAPEAGPTIQHRVAPGYDTLAFLTDDAQPALVLPNIPHRSRTFDSQPMPEPYDLLGRSAVELDVVLQNGVDCQLAAALLDLPPVGAPRFITCGVAALRQLGPGRHRLRIEFDDVGYVLRAGHRLRLSLENLQLYRQPSHTRFGVIPDFADEDLTVAIDATFPPRLELPLAPAQAALTPRIARVNAGGGWDHTLLVDGETGRAGEVYMLLVGASGSAPGIQVGGTPVPLNYDVFTAIAQGSMNNQFLPGFLGSLDSEGTGQGGISLPAAFSPVTLGLRFTFSAIVIDGNGSVTATPPAELVVVP